MSALSPVSPPNPCHPSAPLTSVLCHLPAPVTSLCVTFQPLSPLTLCHLSAPVTSHPVLSAPVTSQPLSPLTLCHLSAPVTPRPVSPLTLCHLSSPLSTSQCHVTSQPLSPHPGAMPAVGAAGNVPPPRALPVCAGDQSRVYRGCRCCRGAGGAGPGGPCGCGRCTVTGTGRTTGGTWPWPRGSGCCCSAGLPRTGGRCGDPGIPRGRGPSSSPLPTWPRKSPVTAGPRARRPPRLPPGPWGSAPASCRTGPPFPPRRASPSRTLGCPPRRPPPSPAPWGEGSGQPPPCPQGPPCRFWGPGSGTGTPRAAAASSTAPRAAPAPGNPPGGTATGGTRGWGPQNQVTHGRALTHRSPEERGAATALPGLQLPRSRAGFWGVFLTPWSWKRILQVICPPTPCSDPQETPGPTVEGTLSLMPGARGRGELQAWHRMGWGSVRSTGDICVPSFLGSALLHGFAPHKTPRGDVWEAASQPHFPGELRMVTGRASSWRGWHEGRARSGGS